MTPTTRVLIVANVTVWSAILALSLVWMFSRFWHSHGRHPRPTEPPSPATAATARDLLLRLVPGTLRDRTQHEGAVPGWSPLAAVAAVTQAPELTTAGEQMVADHQALHVIGEAIAHFDKVIEAELDRFLSAMPLVRMRLPASVEQTGEMPMLAVTG